MPKDISFLGNAQTIYLLFPWLIIFVLLFMTYRLSKNASSSVEFDTSYTVLDNSRISDPFVAKISMRKVAQLIIALTMIFASAWFFRSLHLSIDVMPVYLHSMMEIFSVVVSSMFFAIIWQTYKMKRSINMLILACAFFVGGLLDIAHLLSYRGMPDFISPSGVEKGILFWLFARFSIAVGVLAFALKDWSALFKNSSRYWFLAASFVITAIIYWLVIFYQDIFPPTFVEGEGLTFFKIATEYVIMFIMLVSAFLFCRKIMRTNSYEAIGLFTAIVIMILGELCFVSYENACDLFGLLGHMYKVLAYYLIYRSAFVTRVRWPFWQISQEILSRKTSENEATRERDFANTVFDTAASIIVIFDRSGRIKRFNTTAEQLTGYLFEEVKERYFWDIFLLGEEKVKVKAVFDNIVSATKMTRRHENYWQMKDGTKRLFDWSNAVISDKSGQIEYVVSVGQDITEKKLIQNELKESEERQKEQEKLLMQQAKLAAMGEMVGAIAHQWRQPLNVISYTTMNLGLQHKFNTLDEESLTKMIVSIDTQTQKMSSIISDFLGFFKPHKTKEEFFIVDAFNTVLDMMERQLLNKDIRVALCIDENQKFYGFKNELEQVILNIIVNARDAFVDKKELIDRTVLIEVKHRPYQISIVIKDNAGGIDENIIGRVFEPYFTTKGDGEGTGIGLYMSRLIMQRSFDGDVVVRNISENGIVVGAEFELIINNYVKEEK